MGRKIGGDAVLGKISSGNTEREQGIQNFHVYDTIPIVSRGNLFRGLYGSAAGVLPCSSRVKVEEEEVSGLT